MSSLLNVDTKETSSKASDKYELVLPMIKDKMQLVKAHRIRWDWSSAKAILAEARVKSVRCDEVWVEYSTFFPNITGTIMVNVLDKRFKGAKSQLVFHTAFPTCSYQELYINPNVVMPAYQLSNKLCIEIFSKDLNLTNGIRYGTIKVKCNYVAYEREMQGGVPSLISHPPLYYTRGDLLTDNQISTITKQQGYLGPPLINGRSYVLQGKGKIAEIITEDDVNQHHDKYAFRQQEQSAQPTIIV